MKAIEMKPGIYWVGAKDWDVRDFHGYTTHGGTSYNAYLIIDEQITLVDTVKKPFFSEMLERISSIIDPSKIDNIIINHVEMDHSGSLPFICEIAKNAKIYTSQKGESGLKAHFHRTPTSLPVHVVKGMDTLKIGKRTLMFNPVPMVHWPDSMVTYIPEDKLLLPNDAFGQHFVSHNIFDTENDPGNVLFEARKYYTNIVLPYGAQTMKAIDALSSLEIDMIGPSHGVILTKLIGPLVEKYKKWASHESDKKAVIIYSTMWESTQMMAHEIAGVCEKNNIPFHMFNLSVAHYSDIIPELAESRYVFLGSPTLNNEMMPTMSAFLTYMKGLKPQNKTGFVFGSYGWMPKMLESIQNTLKELKWNIPAEPFNINWVPTDEDLARLSEEAKKVFD